MMIDEVPPYCRPCDELHKESTCPKFFYIIEQEQMEMNNFVGHPRGHDYINNVGQVHHFKTKKEASQGLQSGKG